MTHRIETLAEGVTLHCGDCLDVIATMPANSIDACVTDPPYGLGFMDKGWDHSVPGIKYWQSVYRVLKPGAHLVAFGGTRTYHRMVCAIEDAGFEIRDQLAWMYGSGFPKSHDVSKHIDRHNGVNRPRDKEFRTDKGANAWKVEKGGQARHWIKDAKDAGMRNVLISNDDPITDEAKQWSGWGTALKPACEPICLARKPLSEGTVAANVLRWGTGALNIDATRIPSGADHAAKCASVVGLDSNRNGDCYGEWSGTRTDSHSPLGRWPANVVHDGSEEVVAGFPEPHGAGTFVQTGFRVGGKSEVAVGLNGVKNSADRYGDSGSAARFFYTAKAGADDRLGSKHPTVKPVDLMQWLVRLVTPPGGLVLDPFSGTGTTGAAAFREGKCAVLIEREVEYQADIRRRMTLLLSGAAERAHESVKAAGKVQGHESLPLWAR